MIIAAGQHGFQGDHKWGSCATIKKHQFGAGPVAFVYPLHQGGCDDL